MVYGTAQSGSNPPPNQGLNLTSLEVGERIILFSGTETIATGLKSVAFARGYSPGAGDNGITFNISGMATGTTVDVQVADVDLDASYTSVVTMSPSTTPDTGNAAYTDVGRSAFYRLYVSAYTTGAMFIGTAQR